MVTAPQRFVLPFGVLLETLRGWNTPLTLSASLPHAPEWGPGQPTALVQLVAGQVQSCTIVSARGQPVAGQQVTLTRLRQAGSLEWLVTPSVPATQAYCPRRRDTARLVRATGLSRRHRHLLLLLDGQKSVPELARILGIPPHEIESLLLDLQQEQLLL